MIKILPGKGHGRLDGQVEEEMLLEPVCRFRHPRNPMDQTEFLFPFPENVDEEQYQQAKGDYLKIRKYLLRLTSGKDFEKEEKWIKIQEDEIL